MTAAIAMSLVVLLSACESSEERAEKHFQSGVELLQSGDVERALVEFRNVLQLNANHREARVAYAGVVLGQGRIGEAYRQYLWLVEQQPDDIDSRRKLAELAVIRMDWQEAERHYGPAAELAPDDPVVRSVGLALAYRQALMNEDVAARDATVAETEAFLAEQPDSIILHRILVDGYLRAGRRDAALEMVDKAIALEPDNRQLYTVRLGLLAELGNAEAIEAQILDMLARFPEDESLKPTLLRFYMSQQQADKAEQFLRDQVDPAGENIEPFVELVQFIATVKTREAALAELDAELALRPGNRVVQALRAGLIFELGQTDEGIAAMEAALAGAEPSEETNNLKIALSRMLAVIGNDVGARRLVEEVLVADPSHVEALKMSARWSIDGDNPDAAIASLRTALDRSPQDYEAMTLMAEAHQRNGSRELARDLLSLAVEASNNAPEESIRYARLLASEDNMRAAEDVLINSLRLAPNDIDLFSALGEIYVATEDWARAEQVAASLRRFDTEDATAAADSLQVAILAAQDRGEETIAFLEQLAQTDSSQAVGAQIAIARAHLAAGDATAAVRAVEAALGENPDNPSLRFAAGAIYGATGDLSSAEREYRTLLETNPNAERVWLELVRVQSAQGNREDALATLEQGLTALPGAPNLLWARASVLEQDGDFEGAIAVYETLYEQDSSSPVVANNLASLITTYRDDQESLDRAYAVARRLRGTEVPAFQDTYGWIAYRRGEYQEALAHLEPAANALTEDPLVQFHLAMTYDALGRPEDALARFRSAVELAGEADTRPQFAIARTRIAELEAPAND
ncbi:tetratricopeptide repeat protein [Palleronia sp. KMU-117]|uniref:tetratricopeptide repeat protein n=1 Tax=Palleronia sp. KMU-117 TaxID=3434108 RepID=UPI003D75D648